MDETITASLLHLQGTFGKADSNLQLDGEYNIAVLGIVLDVILNAAQHPGPSLSRQE